MSNMWWFITYSTTHITCTLSELQSYSPSGAAQSVLLRVNLCVNFAPTWLSPFVHWFFFFFLTVSVQSSWSHLQVYDSWCAIALHRVELQVSLKILGIQAGDGEAIAKTGLNVGRERRENTEEQGQNRVTAGVQVNLTWTHLVALQSSEHTHTHKHRNLQSYRYVNLISSQLLAQLHGATHTLTHMHLHAHIHTFQSIVLSWASWTQATHL